MTERTCENCEYWVYLWIGHTQNAKYGGCKAHEYETFGHQWCTEHKEKRAVA